MVAPMPMPLEIVGLDRPEITFEWEDGHRTVYRARDLQLGREVLVVGTVRRHVVEEHTQ